MKELTTRERMLRTYRREEIERIVPAMMEGGGYVFASDHSIPNSVSYDTMRMISELVHRIGRY